MVIGSVITTIGAGLIYTFEINTGAGKWIGYQIIAGAGSGLVIQIPIIVNQALVEPSDLASISAITLFLQTIGGAFWVSAGQAAFVNELFRKLPIKAPNVSPVLVIATGASELHRVFSAADLSGVLVSYMAGLKITFIICIVLAAVSVLISVSPKWESLKGRLQL